MYTHVFWLFDCQHQKMYFWESIARDIWRKQDLKIYNVPVFHTSHQQASEVLLESIGIKKNHCYN